MSSPANNLNNSGRNKASNGGRGQWRGRANWHGRGNWQGGWRGARGRGNWQQRPPPPSKPQESSQNESQTVQQCITDMFEVVSGPYPGWRLYFQDEGFAEGSQTVHKIRAVEGFLRRNQRMFSYLDIRERQASSIDLRLLTADDNFLEIWPKFDEDLSENPEHTLACLSLALHQSVLTQTKKEAEKLLADVENSEAPIPEVPIIYARPLGHQPVLQLQHLKTNCYGKLVSVQGTVIRVGVLKPSLQWMAFSCSTCSGVQTVRQQQGTYAMPTKCRSDGCRSKSFTPLLSSPFTQTVDWTPLRLQEIAADEQREGGRVPRTIECELTNDLVDQAVPGDVVTITGIIRIRSTEENPVKRKTASIFCPYLEAVSVVSNKGRGQSAGVGIEFNMKDFYAIQEIYGEPALFKVLVNSLCPAIYGHELVKAGLLLGLVGGGGSRTGSRSDPHVLVVGDPGLGKSQMLQASAAVAPRGVYVCGNTSTTSGLTVTLSREGGGDYALEAGALVLADQGCCCIDEFDKMTNQHQALLEAMEQQSISIAKAGVVCSLPARTSILAAANPVGGHYNRSKTVAENLRMGNPLLSRFDLVFILMDKPNEHLDNLLTEHVMALHSGLKKRSEHSSCGNTSNLDSTIDGGVPLAERLKLYPNEHINVIAPSVLRKYLAYARKYVVPCLSDEARSVIKQFYLELRFKYQSPDSTPVTTRQLESLIRLAEARAKLELREVATGQDAIDIVEMMKASLVETYANEDGILDFNRSIHGSGMSKRGKAKKFLAILQRRSDAMARSTFNLSELKEVAGMVGVQSVDFYDVLASLNDQGCLLKKGSGIYQLLSADH